MPYKDKAKQREADAAHKRRKYHAPGSGLKEYYTAQIRATRGAATKPPPPDPLSKAAMTAKSLMHKAGLRVFLAGKTTTQMPAAAGPAKASYTGNLKLNRF